MTRLIIFACSLLPLSVASGQRSSSVEIIFPADQANKDFYFVVPLSTGEYFQGNYIRKRTDSNATAVFTIDLSKPGIVAFLTMSFDLIELYVTPGGRTKVNLRDPITFSGTTRKENETLRSLQRRGIAHSIGNSKTFPPELKALLTLSSPDEIIDSAVAYISRDKQILSKIAQQSELSKEFMDFMNMDIEFYYYDIAFATIEKKLSEYLTRIEKSDSLLINSNWGTSLEKLFSVKRNNSPLLRRSQSYFNFLYDYVYWYRAAFLKEQITPVSTFSNQIDGMLFNNFEKGIPQIVEQYLSDFDQETFIPNFISYYINGNITLYTKSMVNYYASFKRTFPESPYMPMLEQKIQGVALVAGASLDDNNPRINLMKSKDLESFDDIVSRFKGKVILIDFWASWCGPCIEEFEHSEKINQLQKQNTRLAVLYVSRDRPEDNKKWEKVIRLKNLEGFHILAGQELSDNLRVKFDITTIPRSVLIDAQGNVVAAHAPKLGSEDLVQLIKGLL